MARVLYHLTRRLAVGIHSLEGGLADNAIPRETAAVIVVPEKDSAVFAEIVDAEGSKIAEELASKDPGAKVQVSEVGKGTFRCVTGEEAGRCASYLIALPNGVQAMSTDMPGLVETSLNLGVVKLKEDALCVSFSVRSCIESAKKALIAKVEAITAMAGGSNTITGDYPGWQYRVNSPLREKMIGLYRRMYGTEPKVEAIHAGLECGLLGSKIRDLDCVSLGPDMRDIHTTEETLSISSTARVWEYLVKLLEEKDA